MLRKQRFARIYEKYADEIYRYIFVHVRDEMLAEDLTADTFSKAWQKLDDFDFRHTRAWLYAIARNRMTDHWRSNRPLPLPEDFDPEDERESVESEVDKEFAKKKLLDAMAELPEEMRSVVALRFIEGYSARKTGEALGISEGNVRVIQYRALKKLKGILS
jgi:RNA polymerase sigma-70 factor (ECF subfamily)